MTKLTENQTKRWSIGKLCDEYGVAKAEEALSYSITQTIKSELLNRNVKEAEGKLFRITCSDTTSFRINADIAKMKMKRNYKTAMFQFKLLGLDDIQAKKLATKIGVHEDVDAWVRTISKMSSATRVSAKARTVR